MFEKTIDSVETLRSHYREPSQLVQDKVINYIDEGASAFIASSSFVLVATSGGVELDVSPRGGPPGFVKVIDEQHLVIPDLSGNNRLDSLQNLLMSPSIGLLFLIPGLGETLRVNGTACITVDDAVLDLFQDDSRRPKTAIGVTVEEAHIHCAKSIRRGKLWDPSSWLDADRRPSVGDILIGHAGIKDKSAKEVEDSLNAAYDRALAED